MPQSMVNPEQVQMYLAMQKDCLYLRTWQERAMGLRGRMVPIADVEVIIASQDLVSVMVGDNVYSHHTNGRNFIAILAEYGHDFTPTTAFVFHPA